MEGLAPSWWFPLAFCRVISFQQAQPVQSSTSFWFGRPFPHPVFTSAPGSTRRSAWTRVFVGSINSYKPNRHPFHSNNYSDGNGRKKPRRKKKGICSSRNFDCYMKYKNKFLQNKTLVDEVATLDQVIKWERKKYLCWFFWILLNNMNTSEWTETEREEGTRQGQ